MIVRFKRFHLQGPSQIVVRDNDGRIIFEAYLNGAGVFVASTEPIHDAHDRQESSERKISAKQGSRKASQGPTSRQERERSS